MQRFYTKNIIVGACATFLILGGIGVFVYNLFPVAPVGAPSVVFEVKPGDGFRGVITHLKNAGIVRSSLVTEMLALLTGSALHLQPGLYHLSAAMSPWTVLSDLAANGAGEVTVMIPEGENIYQIDALLADALVIRRGALINLKNAKDLEGKLFPDTYRFYTNAPVGDVVAVMTQNFDTKAAPLLPAASTTAWNDLIVASIVEKEVSGADDQKIVAGIVWKRLQAGMPLQMDATICYGMWAANPLAIPNCGSLDLKFNSLYNSYLYRGLPPGPIGNPGISAIRAAVSPVSSSYWYYLSDPATGKTIFAKTLDEQHQNTVKYLKGH